MDNPFKYPTQTRLWYPPSSSSPRHLDSSKRSRERREADDKVQIFASEKSSTPTPFPAIPSHLQQSHLPLRFCRWFSRLLSCCLSFFLRFSVLSLWEVLQPFSGVKIWIWRRPLRLEWTDRVMRRRPEQIRGGPSVIPCQNLLLLAPCVFCTIGDCLLLAIELRLVFLARFCLSISWANFGVISCCE